MAKFNANSSPLWVQKRVIAFINGAKKASDIVERVKDSPNNGQGYGIGETVAKRILSKRNSLPARRFRTIEQFSDIEGLGEDKFEDLLSSFNLLSAEEFRNKMFSDKFLYDNWEFGHHTLQFPDRKNFQQTVSSTESLKHYIAEQIKTLVFKEQQNRTLAKLAAQSIRSAYVENYPEAYLASYAWALWFFGFDADNWFSFEAMRLRIETYLSTFYYASEDIGLFLFKGFENNGTLTDGIGVLDLPITVSYAEQSISIWWATLFD
ncbi:MAG: hypothetical protein AAF927_01835 [Bacteroidota bacterium]